MKEKDRIKTLVLSILAAFLLIVLTVKTAGADIFLYVDEQGIFHFTNVPTSPRYRIYLQEATPASGNRANANRFDHYIRSAASLYGISASLLKSIIKVESDFNPRAVSSKGAMGLMQIMPKTVERLNLKNPFDPHDNIMAGTRYLQRLLNRFDGNVLLALAAYHAGPTTVERYKDIPPIKSTRAYVQRVLKYYQIYKKG